MNHRKRSSKGRQINSKRKHRDGEGEWHHRVPDFKLVYCGTKQDFSEKE